jgi:hypothetical protein
MLPPPPRQEAAADLRDRSKYRAHAGHLLPGGTFVSASVETHGHLGRRIMWYARTLSDIASARSPAVTQLCFLKLADAHWELRMALVQIQGNVYLLLLARASAQQVSPGANTAFLD